MRRAHQISLLAFLWLIAACGPEKPPISNEVVEKEAIVQLICGAEPEAACLASVCQDTADCALIQALSDKTVFDFVTTYSDCPDCSTPRFSPELGLGQCIEYQVADASAGATVTFWVSESCAFRYGRPTESRLAVRLNSATSAIEQINPPIQYVQDPLYCQTDQDCLLLSGSGVAVIGCHNYFYAPLNGSGYYPDKHCDCSANQCRQE